MGTNFKSEPWRLVKSHSLVKKTQARVDAELDDGTYSPLRPAPITEFERSQDDVSDAEEEGVPTANAPERSELSEDDDSSYKDDSDGEAASEQADGSATIGDPSEEKAPAPQLTPAPSLTPHKTPKENSPSGTIKTPKSNPPAASDAAKTDPLSSAKVVL